MKFIEVKINASSYGVEVVTAMLMNYGIDNISISDQVDLDELLDKKNDYDWDYIDESVIEQCGEEAEIKCYLDVDDKQILDEIMCELLNLRTEDHKNTNEEFSLGSLKCVWYAVDDEDWKYKWKEFFKPTKISDRLVVKPTWETYEKQDESVMVIKIDPGMAFGTGTHETTKCCINLMEKYMKQGADVLDVGSGSGILSIAAALLGAENVLGVEIDPIAVDVGIENVKLNGLSDRVEIAFGDLTKGVDFKADIVVANINAHLVKLLSDSIALHLKEGGVYISSGILTDLKDDVMKTIKDNGFEILEVLIDGEWCGIAAKVRA